MSRGKPAPIVEGVVEALTHDGKGIVADAGKKVFVTGALPGERVRYQRIRRRRSFDEARLVEVIDPDPGRQDPRCPVFGVCGGCAMQHMTAAQQIAHKSRVLEDNLARIGGLPDVTLAEPLAGPVWHYRRRARLGVKYVHAKERVLVGFRERAKPYITDMQACPVLERAAAELPGSLAGLIGGLSIRAELPQVEVAIGDNAKALVFRVLRTPSGDDLEALAAFERQSGFRVLLQPGGLTSVVPLATFAGKPAANADAPLHYRIEAAGVTLRFEPTDFI
ncbi:MAG: 23S rRNA (uracil(1939)-C(5))-methyltransferase, partial [Pseudomonadota bacterium]